MAGGDNVTDPTDRLVVVIDDDDLIRPILQRSLRRKDIEVHLVGSAEEAAALDDAVKARAGVIICDATVDDLELDAVAEDFRAHAPRAQLLVTSGFPPDHLESRGIHVERYPFLQKPWSIKQLVEQVVTMLAEVDEPDA